MTTVIWVTKTAIDTRNFNDYEDAIAFVAFLEQQKGLVNSIAVLRAGTLEVKK